MIPWNLFIWFNYTTYNEKTATSYTRQNHIMPFFLNISPSKTLKFLGGFNFYFELQPMWFLSLARQFTVIVSMQSTLSGVRIARIIWTVSRQNLTHWQDSHDQYRTHCTFFQLFIIFVIFVFKIGSDNNWFLLFFISARSNKISSHSWMRILVSPKSTR